jgi:hypothetical protein
MWDIMRIKEFFKMTIPLFIAFFIIIPISHYWVFIQKEEDENE